MSRLYIIRASNHHNAMHMIRHNNEFVYIDTGEMNGYLHPISMGDFSDSR